MRCINCKEHPCCWWGDFVFNFMESLYFDTQGNPIDFEDDMSILLSKYCGFYAPKQPTEEDYG